MGGNLRTLKLKHNLKSVFKENVMKLEGKKLSLQPLASASFHLYHIDYIQHLKSYSKSP